MANVNDGTHQCARQGCGCKVTDDKNNVKAASGVFCCQECADGKGCSHPGCDCASGSKK